MRILFFVFGIAITLVLFCGFTGHKTETYSFSVFRDDKKIGDLVTKSELVSGCTLYSLSSDVKIEMLVDILISERISNKYENGKLISASHNRTVNGINHSKRQLRYENDGYVSDSGKPMTNTGSWIGASVLRLYHSEPIGLSAVYSEAQACWIKLIPQKKGKYKALLPDGKSTTFSYTNGLLYMVVSETNWGQVVFKKMD